MNFCSHCGSPLDRRVPRGDDRPRFVCDACQTIHDENPRTVVGCIPEWEEKILLCPRGIQPRRGFWTLPAGFLEQGETLKLYFRDRPEGLFPLHTGRISPGS